VSGGAGDDTVGWNPGGGSDVVDGGSWVTTPCGSTPRTSARNISVLDFGGHAFVTRDIAGITLDTTSVERIAFGAAGGGADHYFLAGLGRLTSSRSISTS
jgi:hypothetical protein